MSHRIRFANLSVFLECPAPDADWASDLAYLEEFLSPTFRFEAAVRPAPGEPSVVLVASDEAHAALLAARPDQALAEPVLFVMDQSELRGREWRSGATRYVEDASHGVVYAIASNREITIVASTKAARRRALFRVVRELVQAPLTQTLLVLHAAAVSWAGAGMAIAGVKRSGKTSLLLYLLGRGATYLANDRAVVEPGSLEMRGLPTLISVRAECLDLFPSLREGLAKADFHSHRTIAEALASPTRPRRSVEVSPPQLCLLRGATMGERARLDVVLLPSARDIGTRFELRRLSRREALARLPEVRFGTRNPGRISDVFGTEEMRGHDAATGAWRECVARVPIVECRLGSFAPEHNQDFLARVQDLIAAGPAPEDATQPLPTTAAKPARRPRWPVLACAIAKNEAANLVEWIEFHRLIGVTFFAVYDNGSSDDTAAVLAPYVRDGLVEHIPWPEHPGQLRAYEDCVQRHRDRARWMAFIDIDEMVVPPFGQSLPDFLAPYEGSNGLGINWLVFGTSGHATRPAGLTIESYLGRAHSSHPDHRHIKTIADPRRIAGAGMNPHYFVYEDGGSVLDECLEPIPLGAFSREHRADRIRINHYFSRSAEELARKIERGRATTSVPRPASVALPQNLAPLSATRDERMLQYVPLLRERIAARPR